MRQIEQAKIDQIITMHKEGVAKYLIAKDLKINPITVRKYIRKDEQKSAAAASKFLRIRKRKKVSSYSQQPTKAAKPDTETLRFVAYVCGLKDVDVSTKVKFIKKALGV